MMRALKILQHSPPKRPQHSPFPAEKRKYGATIKYAEVPDLSGNITAPEVTRAKKIIGKFYYYARAVNNTMLSSLGELSTNRTIGTATPKVADNVIWFLNYSNTHPNEKIRYHTSGMILHVHRNTAYLLIEYRIFYRTRFLYD